MSDKPLGYTKKGQPRKRAAGAGRKPLPEDERSSRRITMRLFLEDEAALAALCAALDLSESEVLRHLVREAAKKLQRRAK